MRYIVKCEKTIIVEADSKEEAKEQYDAYGSLYEEEEITSVDELPEDSLYNDYC